MEDPHLHATSWQMIELAAAGDGSELRRFASRYEPVIVQALRRRWRSGRFIQFVDDARQEVFVECLRQGGVLESIQRGRPHSFRAFLVGVVRNVARRFETTERPGSASPAELNELTKSDEDLLDAFEREWARQVVAASLLRLMTKGKNHARSQMRADLLRLRFTERLPIRDIASRWSLPAAQVHREYARARRDFRTCLEEEVARWDGLPKSDLAAECRRLTGLLATPPSRHGS